MNQIRLCRPFSIMLCLCTSLFVAQLATNVMAQPVCPQPAGEPVLCPSLTPNPCAGGPAGTQCYPTKVRFNPGVPGFLEAIDCDCVQIGQSCGPISFQGDLVRCPGPCLPPFPAGSQCQVIVNGVPTGAPDANFTTFPPGTEFECGCGDGGQQDGACCLPDGSCTVGPASSCQAAGGTYLGDGSLCGGPGACCYDADGDGVPETCQVVDERCCEVLFGGAFQGIDTSCIGDVACCLSDGTCKVLDELCCNSIAGFIAPAGACLGDNNGNMIDDGCEDPIDCGPTPDRLGCLPATCPVPGQECLPRCLIQRADGTLVVDTCECISPNECHLEFDPASAVYTCVGACPAGFSCQTTTTLLANGETRICCECVPDVPLDGACCQPDGTCVVVPPTACLGIFLGVGTTCQGDGACCYDADGDGLAETCTVVDEVCCEVIYSGFFSGFGTVCAGDVACCLSDGSCLVMDQTCCNGIGGVLAPAGACLGDNNGNGVDDGCEDPGECLPSSDRTHCLPTVCPNPGEECLPRCVRVFPDGTMIVETCECVSPDQCHLEFDATVPTFTCVGDCPPGMVCQTSFTVDPVDLSKVFCCECVPEDPGFCPLPMAGPQLCAPLQQSQCQSNDPNHRCLPRQISITNIGGAIGLQADECICFGPGDECGPITMVTDTIARCVGLCPVPPYLPGDDCLVRVNGVLTASPSIDTSTLAVGDTIDCGCGSIEVQGACCRPDGSCVVVPASVCVAPNVYLGDGTVCGDVGGCCYDTDNDGIPESCSVMNQICCELVVGGTFQGPGTLCIGQGACCYDVPGGPVGQCVVLDRLCCDDIGGVFQGLGTVCLGDANGDGSDDLCVPTECGPAFGGQSCLPTICPNAGEECLPRCILILDDGTIQIIDCECRSVDECHLEWSPGTQPVCVGDCPPGFRCETRTFATPIGTQICCDCVPDPDCEPTDDLTDCKPHICPDPTEQCVPRCVRVGPNGQVEVLDCDCRRPDECRVSDFAPGDLPICTGNCPPGQVCVENLIVLADGTVELCCDCADVECDCPGDINGDGIRDGLDIGGFVRCLLGNPLPGDNCSCADVDEDGDVDIDDATFLVAVILSKAPCPKQELCPPEDLVFDISTGVDDNGNILPLNVNDDSWTVISEPPPVGTLPRPAVTIPPNAAWNTIPGTRWISANQTGPNGTYIYELCFCLDKRYSNPVLTMALRADDEIDVFLNGNLVASPPAGTFNDPNPFGISVINPAFFQAGENCIQVVVRNTGGVVTGFNLQGSVRAVSGKCCCDPEDLSRDLASGRDDNGNLIPSGADDDTWTVTVDAGGGTVPRPATVINPNSAWLTIPGTKWISAGYTGPNGFYTYEYCFCLEKWFENAQLVLDLRADDRAEVFLNGNLVGATPLSYSFNSPLPTNVTVTNQSLFLVGENCVEVVVRNTHGVVTGVNMDGSVTARNGLCCDDRAECGPTPDGSACEAVTCPDSGETCVPVCYNINGNIATVVDCDCRGPDECHAVTTDSIPPQVVCVGDCPPGQECIQRVIQQADGSIDYCCECVDTPITGACCFSVGGCVILSQQACQQQGGAYLGDFTSCLGDEACCLPNGSCVITDVICCEFLLQGSPQGAGSVCLGDNDGDGRDDLCYPPDCGPVPGTINCRPVVCPNPGEECLPRCVRVEQGTTFVIEVLDCECVSPNECHMEIDPLTNNYYCVGGCPILGTICRTTVVDLGDGTQRVCCECVDSPPPLSCCNLDTGFCLDLAPGSTVCPVGYSLVQGPCGFLQACCLPSGACIDSFEACCNEMGGMPQGAGTDCANSPCPVPECLPIPGTPICQSTICPLPGQKCKPRCVRVEQGTTYVIEVLDCECVTVDECHIEVDANHNYQCVGGCQLAGQICQTTVVDLGDGTERVCCECIDDPVQRSCCNIQTGQCLDLAPGVMICPTGFTLVNGPCGVQEACCLPDGTCIDAFVPCCLDQGGMPQGAGTDCTTTPCGDPVECVPVPGTPFCASTNCPIPGEVCLPRCVRVEPGTTFVLEVLDCECISPNECHIEVDAANNYQCVGGCPLNEVCRTTTTLLADGTLRVCCECVPEVSDVCPINPLPGSDQCVSHQSTECISTDPTATCSIISVFADPAVGPVLERCACVREGECGAMELVGDVEVRCVNDCPTGIPCQVFADGVPQGPGIVNILQFPPGTRLTCGCE